MFDLELRLESADPDIRKIVTYLAYLREQMEFNDANVKRRLSALEEGTGNGGET